MDAVKNRDLRRFERWEFSELEALIPYGTRIHFDLMNFVKPVAFGVFVKDGKGGGGSGGSSSGQNLNLNLNGGGAGKGDDLRKVERKAVGKDKRKGDVVGPVRKPLEKPPGADINSDANERNDGDDESDVKTVYNRYNWFNFKFIISWMFGYNDNDDDDTLAKTPVAILAAAFLGGPMSPGTTNDARNAMRFFPEDDLFHGGVVGRGLGKDFEVFLRFGGGGGSGLSNDDDGIKRWFNASLKVMEDDWRLRRVKKVAGGDDDHEEEDANDDERKAEILPKQDETGKFGNVVGDTNSETTSTSMRSLTTLSLQMMSIEQIEMVHELIVSVFCAFAKWMDDRRLPYWLFGESLVGWRWNKKRLPWSGSVHVQVSVRVINELLLYSGGLLHGRYRLVMHPTSAYAALPPKVSARFVDIETNLFVSISVATAISWFPGYLEDPELHRVHLSDISPLIRTSFDGVPTWVPSNPDNVLTSIDPEMKYQEPVHGSWKFVRGREDTNDNGTRTNSNGNTATIINYNMDPSYIPILHSLNNEMNHDGHFGKWMRQDCTDLFQMYVRDGKYFLNGGSVRWEPGSGEPGTPCRVVVVDVLEVVFLDEILKGEVEGGAGEREGFKSGREDGDANGNEQKKRKIGGRKLNRWEEIDMEDMINERKKEIENEIAKLTPLVVPSQDDIISGNSGGGEVAEGFLKATAGEQMRKKKEEKPVLRKGRKNVPERYLKGGIQPAQKKVVETVVVALWEDGREVYMRYAA
ncbi:hypothetical protein HDU76_005527 [Blyttiomyces sp. JEL0837]|nr:hypothetical protein HDU76_005527 [Blyttiomyces sp. JEL0837]